MALREVDMACGNPDISREQLASEPAQLTHPTASPPTNNLPSPWLPGGKETPPDVGVILGHEGIFSFKVGVTGDSRDEHTLIKDGDYSDDAAGFNAAHNHYGPKAESPGDRFNDDRGHYTGPDH
jgi:hypothetical protein